MSFQYPGGSNGALFDSPADWIAPGGEYGDDPPAADGKKLILADTDHLGGKPLGKGWVWRSFMRGLNPVNYGLMALGTMPEKPTELDEAARAMGHTHRLAAQVDLARMTPRNDLASTSYCLAAPGAEYLVYQPEAGGLFTVDLKPGTYHRAWLDAATGVLKDGGTVEARGGAQRFKSPLEGEAVLHLKAAAAPPSPGRDRK
jgi:hypothetical protein